MQNDFTRLQREFQGVDQYDDRPGWIVAFVFALAFVVGLFVVSAVMLYGWYFG